MLAKFKSFPITVQLAMIFLSGCVIAAIVTAPEIAIPLVLIFGSVVSAMRIAIFLVEKK